MEHPNLNRRSFYLIFGLLVVLIFSADTRTSAASWECADLECKQIMLTLAFMADLSSGLSGDSISVTQATKARVECFLPKATTLNNDWSVVWGPVVITEQYQPTGLCAQLFSKPKKPVPANTMFVAKKKDEDIYTIAIAVTNPDSAYDWCVEDLGIALEDWPSGNPPSNAKVATGFLTGLQKLQVLKDGSQNLTDYLRTVTGNSEVKVYVTGHSLGGALAPITALWLKNIQSYWDPSSNATLIFYAFAGPTPGNKSLADYINGQFPGGGGDDMAVVNNTLDVVPHAFNLGTLNEISQLYSSVDIHPTTREWLAIQGLIDRVKSSGYTTVGSASQQQPVTGKLIPPSSFGTANCLVLKKLPSTSDDFQKEALYQHDCGYPNQLDLPQLNANLAACRQ